VTIDTTAALDNNNGVPNSSIDRSDMILGAQFHYGAGISTESALEYSDSQGIVEREVYGVAWNAGEHEVVNLAYRYNRENSTIDNLPINQALFSTQWPLTRKLIGVARLDYDIGSNRVIDGLVGFQYDSDCWSFGLGVQRYAESTVLGLPSSGTRFLAQLVLKGLSKVDNGLASSFAGAVQGYQPLPGPPPVPSPFSNFP